MVFDKNCKFECKNVWKLWMDEKEGGIFKVGEKVEIYIHRSLIHIFRRYSVASFAMPCDTVKSRKCISYIQYFIRPVLIPSSKMLGFWRIYEILTIFRYFLHFYYYFFFWNKSEIKILRYHRNMNLFKEFISYSK